MLLGGDEFGRTQRGNNNAYCQDNETSWLDWRLLERNRELFRFVCRLVRFRKSHPSLRRRAFFEDDPEGAAVVWHGQKLNKPDFDGDPRGLAFHLLARGGDEDIYMATNAHWEPRAFDLPRLRGGRTWRRFVDTNREPPHDATEPGVEAPLGPGRSYPLGPRSLIVLVGR